MNRIIVALDGLDNFDAAKLSDDLIDDVAYVKINSLFIDNQDFLTFNNTPIMLDLKFYDIPNTVANHIHAATNLANVEMLTIHASGGVDMMKAAVDAADGKIKILAVTVLTSFDSESWHNTHVGACGSIESYVKLYAEAAVEAGVDGIVCSPHEIELVRNVSDDILIVTPGVRPEWAQNDDQKRVMTPEEAISKGADYLVIGRPITKSDNPADATARINESLEGDK